MRFVFQYLWQPFVYQHHIEITAFIAKYLFIFIAIAKHQRRVDPHHRHAKFGHTVKIISGFLSPFS